MTNDPSRVRLRDLAERLGLSIGTVSRALQDHPGLNKITKQRVLRLAKSMGYAPNLAARYLVSGRSLRIGVNTPREIAYFYDAVRRGINDEAMPFRMAGVELIQRTFPTLGDGERAAFEEALDDNLDGLILVPGPPGELKESMRRAAKKGLPVICLVNDIVDAKLLSTVSVNTASSAAMVADLMGRFLNGKGTVGVTIGDIRISDHVEKFSAFKQTLARFHPGIKVLPPIENHERESEAYSQTRSFLKKHSGLDGLYVSTGVGPTVLKAVEDTAMLGKLALFFTDVFETLLPHLRSGVVHATLYERPYSQGRIAFRLMQEYLVEGHCPTNRVSLEPLLLMRSNIDLLSPTRSGGAPLNAGSRALVDELLLLDQQS